MQSVAQLTADSMLASLNYSSANNVEIDHEIISVIIPPFPLIQEGQLSITDHLNMTLTVLAGP